VPAHLANDDYDDDPIVAFVEDDLPGSKPKNKKANNVNFTNNTTTNKKGNAGCVETRHEGYILERAEALPGQKLSWARVGKRSLPFDETKLVNIVNAHRAKTSTGPATIFKQLTSNQQGVIDRLIAEHMRDEKHANADWILLDLQRLGTRRTWRGPAEVHSLQLILRRQDRTTTRSTDKTVNASNAYSGKDIIDLTKPFEKTATQNTAKGGKKAGKQDKIAAHDLDDIFDDLPGVGGPPHGVDHRPHDQGQWQPNHGMAIPVGHAQHPHPPQPAPMPIPVPMHEQFHPNHPMQPPPMNPFHPEFVPQEQFEPHFNGGYEERQGPRMRVRSPAPRRRSSSRRSSRERRRLKRLEGKVEEVIDKLDHWHLSSDSSESPYEEDSLFSQPSGGSFTPPSTPPRSIVGPAGSLHRRKSGHRGEHRRPREYGRRHAYRDEHVEMEPAYAPRRPHEREGRYNAEGPRYAAERPRRHRANTYDDYPAGGRAAEPRYLPPPRVQRRLTDFGEAYDEVANYDNELRRLREDRRRAEAFELPRRREPVMRHGRRNSVIGGAEYWR